MATVLLHFEAKIKGFMQLKEQQTRQCIFIMIDMLSIFCRYLRVPFAEEDISTDISLRFVYWYCSPLVEVGHQWMVDLVSP